MLYDALVTLYADKVAFDIVINLNIVEPAEIFSVKVAEFLDLLVECPSYVRCHIEIECRDCLPAMHLVLDCFH